MNSVAEPTSPALPRMAVGFDIGGTKISCGVIDDRGESQCAARSYSTPQNPAAIVPALHTIANELRTQYPSIAAVGVGAAGLVDWPEGRIRWAPNNSYRDMPLRAMLEEACGLPTVVDNDANVAALAEFRLSGIVGDLLFLTLGTGVGGGLILNGQIFRGSTGIAAEVGHMIVDAHSGVRCGCGNFGCLEAVASGTAVGRYGQEAAIADPSGGLASLSRGSDEVSGETVFLAAAKGDPIAKGIYERVGNYLGIAIASLVSVLDLRQIVIGGGMSIAGDFLLPGVRSSLTAHLFAREYRVAPLVALARHGADAGWMGAGLLALDCAAPMGSAAPNVTTGGHRRLTTCRTE